MISVELVGIGAVRVDQSSLVLVALTKIVAGSHRYPNGREFGVTTKSRALAVSQPMEFDGDRRPQTHDLRIALRNL